MRKNTSTKSSKSSSLGKLRRKRERGERKKQTTRWLIRKKRGSRRQAWNRAFLHRLSLFPSGRDKIIANKKECCCNLLIETKHLKEKTLTVNLKQRQTRKRRLIIFFGQKEEESKSCLKLNPSFRCDAGVITSSLSDDGLTFFSHACVIKKRHMSHV